MNLLDQLYSLRDQLQGLVNNPQAFMQQLQTNHVLLVEVIAGLFLVLFLLYLLLKPAGKPRPKKSVPVVVQEAEPTVQKAKSRSAKGAALAPEVVISGRSTHVKQTVKAVQEEARQIDARRQQEELEAQQEAEREKARLQELSAEEEQALARAIEEAGQLALADVAGEPHQAEFFEKEGLAETAAKNMFAKPKEEMLEAESPMQVPLKKTGPAPRIDFLMLYYMAPRSQAYSVVELFNLFDHFNLHFNSDNVFEFSDDEGVQFYLASALKPGAFTLDPLAQVPGLSFVLDLNKVEHPRAAFGKMLKFIDELTRHLKGDVLDERRQRMTTSTMNEYLARIKSLRKN